MIIRKNCICKSELPKNTLTTLVIMNVLTLSKEPVESDNDTGDTGDGSVRDFRSGWITSDHNAPTVVESGRQLCQTLANCYAEYQVSPLRAPVSLRYLSVQNLTPRSTIADGGSMLLNVRHK